MLTHPGIAVWPARAIGATKTLACVKLTTCYPQKGTTTMEIKIERNIPVPDTARPSRSGWSRFPWALMKVGDSFFVAGYVTASSKEKGTKMSATQGRKLLPKSSWAIRNVREKNRKGVRVWRVA